MFEEVSMLQLEFIENQVSGIYNLLYGCVGGCIIAFMMVGVMKLFTFNKKVVEESHDPIIRIKNRQ